MVYMVTFSINISSMLAYIPYMDPMGFRILKINMFLFWIVPRNLETLEDSTIHENLMPLSDVCWCVNP